MLALVVSFVKATVWTAAVSSLFNASRGMALAGGTAPLITNYAYDLTQSYYPVMWSFVPISLFCAFLFFSVGRNPALEDDQPVAAINARISSAGIEQGAA